jgi:hypothetical protein
MSQVQTWPGSNATYSFGRRACAGHACSRCFVNSVMEKKLSPGTIEHIRSTMHLLFDEAWRLEIIPENPVLEVKVPPIAYVGKPRVILTDDEVIVFWAGEDAELEIQIWASWRGARAG